MANKATYRELEERVRELEMDLQRDHRILENAKDGIWIYNLAADRFTYSNDANREMSGYTREEESRLGLADVVAPQHLETVSATFTDEILRDKEEGVDPDRVITLEIEQTRKDGSLQPVELTTSFLRDGDGEITDTLGITRDISKRKQAEETLRWSKRIFDASNDHLALVGSDYRYKMVNASYLRSHRKKGEDIIGHTTAELFGDDFFRRDQKALIDRCLNGETVRFQTWADFPVPGRIYLDITYSPYSGEDNVISGYVVNARDITDLKVSEEVLRESQQRMEVALQGADLGTWDTVLPSGEKTYNERYAEMLGYALDEFEALEQLDADVHPDDLPRTAEAWSAHVDGETDSYEVECRMKHKSGHWVWVLSRGRIIEYDNDGSPLRASGTHLDITERKRLETQLQQALKMEAIGTLAGGIAHDFNNMLGIILGNTEMAALDVPDQNPARANLDEIRKTTLRARDTVKRILAFSRQGDHKLTPIQIGPVISESLKLIRSSIATSTEIQQNVSEDAGVIMGDSTQINQVLLNLCVNASHAMQDEGGILSVALERIHLDDSDLSGMPDLSAGDHIKLSVGDTGQGIAPDHIDRIFDPYFTTKGVSEGTGMGLAMVRGIVKQHYGEITVNSEIGKGTTFDIFFPIADEEPEAETLRAVDIPSGNERILFVDDEPAMTEIYQSMLERLGYTVSIRTSSIEALEAFKARPDKYDLIITDQTMPHMTGQVLAKEMRAIRPDIPIILCTGHSDLIDGEKAKGMGIQAFVMKPIAMGDIAKTIREVLD